MSSMHSPWYLETVLTLYALRHVFSYDLQAHIINLAGFLTCESGLYRNWDPPFSVYSHLLYLRADHLTVYISGG